ncbi:hypothetical protein NIT60_05420 [Mammaliicoccus sciuri]|nr:hypothetical protein NIT60_05420 [Mammaliicoccus sciuri]
MVKENDKAKNEDRSKKKFSMPHIYVILFVFGVIATISTYLIPSGEFDRVKGPEGREMVDADSFHYIDSAPVGLVDFISIIPRGLIGSRRNCLLYTYHRWDVYGVKTYRYY